MVEEEAKPDTPMTGEGAGASFTTLPKRRETTRQIFIDVLDQANTPVDFLNDVLLKKRIFGFQMTIALSNEQHENIKAFVDKTNDEGYLMDYLQFCKLINALKYYCSKNEVDQVAWNNFDGDMILDLINNYMDYVDTINKKQIVLGDSAIPCKLEEVSTAPGSYAISVEPDAVNSSVLMAGKEYDPTAGYAKRSLKPFESLKFPPKPIMCKDIKSWKPKIYNVLLSMNLKTNALKNVSNWLDSFTTTCPR